MSGNRTGTTIADYGIDDVTEAIHLLLRLGEDWKLRPVEVADGHFFLESHDQDIFNEVRAWGEMCKRLETGAITALECITWRDGYTAKKRMV